MVTTFERKRRSGFRVKALAWSVNQQPKEIELGTKPGLPIID